MHPTLPDFNQLKKALKQNLPATKTIRVALAADSASQFLCTALQGYAALQGLKLDLYEAPYNQIGLQVFNPASELNDFKAKYIILFESTQHLQKHFYHTPLAERGDFAQHHLQQIGDYAEAAQRNGAKLIYYNFTDCNDGVFGNFASNYSRSFPAQLRLLNARLTEVASQHKNMFVVDLLSLQSRYGQAAMIDPKVYIQTDMVLGTEILPAVAKLTVDTISAIEGTFKKCLILDLDNTVWGGIIGDDGLNNIQVGGLGAGKAFTQLQQWAKELKNRGIILCVASKNTEHIAMEPFEKHPDMVLRMEDISVFMANWDNKVKNIQRIQEILNIGFDSMVFVDDNPFERNMVRENLPAVTVPELPEDPSLYLDYLLSLNLFETASVSDNDEIRTHQYRQEAKRVAAQQYFENEDEYLKSLDMVATIEGLTDFNLPRVAQLTQRSNQFNLRTERFTEEEMLQFSKDSNNSILNFQLADKYGDHGLIAIIMLQQQGKEMFINNWIMSCRVLKRGMENFTLNTIVDAAKTVGCTMLKGEYIPTPKNGIVENNYADLGFTFTDNYWTLNITEYTPLKTFIEKKI